ncbi:MAG: hypothetical protein HDT30_09355 [Clostridiales bacterium]|nr:hypothetical protein [Clostridiales bacterium]
MVFHKIQKAIAVSVIASLVATSTPSASYTKILEANAKATDSKQVVLAGNADVSENDEGVFKVTMDDTGYITADNEYAATVDTPFSWDNVNMYFVITDRFYNGDKTNDHAYERSTREKGADKYENRIGTFHGGDLKGMTEKIEEGYFDELGTNAIWITAPYEQIHGALCSDKFKHYAYHGYYTLDYTNVDGNMGTAEDLEKFIDTAHTHGIRVVFDIVMNHAGYADAYTANEYGFGKLASNWEEIYYEWDESQYQWYNDYEGEAASKGSQGMMVADGDWVSNWWGPSWIRALGNRLSGYQGEEGSGVETCLDGLPDFKTETTNDPGIPSILKNKWTKEGNYDDKVAMTNSSLQAAGLSKSVTGYIASWLSEWVREYGVDGFRCDTAKHVNVSEWVKLKNACKVALNDWRKNNPDKPGAQWKDDFWMTGEHWDHGVGKDSYYTSGAFDSMINFSYKGNESKSGSGLETTYSSYASQINSDPSFNVLSYISSHDTSLGARSANAGTALLLTPGGVQTYYGDESGRQSGGGSGDQPTRSHMNWSSMDEKILSNWQKVGRFRRNHIAVGAGQHKKIADSPYTFSRTYTGKATVGSETKTDYEDKVVVCLPGSAGTNDVSVGTIFEDGATVVDEYSGEEYTVSGGKVEGVKCDSNGVILLAEPAVSTPKAKIMSSVSKGTESAGVYNTDSLTLKLSTQNVKDASYQINDCEPVAFTESTEVTIGEDTAYEEKTVIKIQGTSELDGEAVSKEFTYTRGKEPVIGAATEGFSLRVKKSDFTAAPNIWIWSGVTNYCTNEWPGDLLTEDGDYYVYNNAQITGSANFIISQGNYRNTQEGETELSANGSVLFDKSSNSVEEYLVATGEPCKVTVEYLNGSGEVIKTITRVGAEGDTYKVYAPESLSTVPGSKLADGEDSTATGTFSPEGKTIQFKYSVNGEVVKTDPPTPTSDTKETEAPTPTSDTKETEAPTPTSDTKATQVPPTQVPPTKVPPTNIPADKTPVPSTPTPEEEFVVTLKASKKSVVAGKTVKLTAGVTGGNGNYTYKFVAEKGSSSSTIRAFAKTPSFNWKPTKAGTYTIVVYAKDTETGNMTTDEVTVKVTAAPLTITLFKVLNLGKLKVQLKANATGGTGTLKYKYTYTYKGKTKTIKKYSGTKSLKKVMKKAGTYTFKVYVKDSKNSKIIKTKTFKLKVKKK